MKKLNVIVQHNPIFGRCPDCHESGTLHRSHARTNAESIIKKITFFKIYRCKKCGWRGFRSTFIITLQSFKSILLYIAIAIAAAFIIRYILLKFLVN